MELLVALLVDELDEATEPPIVISLSAAFNVAHVGLPDVTELLVQLAFNFVGVPIVLI